MVWLCRDSGKLLIGFSLCGFVLYELGFYFQEMNESLKTELS